MGKQCRHLILQHPLISLREIHAADFILPRKQDIIVCYSYLAFAPLVYGIRKSDYSESLMLPYTDKDSAAHQEPLGSSRSMLSNWMELLNYDTEDKETPNKAFDLLISSVKLLGIGEDNPMDGIGDFIKGIDS